MLIVVRRIDIHIFLLWNDLTRFITTVNDIKLKYQHI